MEVSGHLCSPAVLTPGRTPAPVDMWLCGPQTRCGLFFLEKGQFLPLPRFEPDYYILAVLGAFQTLANMTFK